MGATMRAGWSQKATITDTIAATNATGTVASASYTMRGVTCKRVVISLSKQRL